jgi:hypothetical protein
MKRAVRNWAYQAAQADFERVDEKKTALIEAAKRKAAEPIKPTAQQTFDLTPLPLFGDQMNQKELF